MKKKIKKLYAKIERKTDFIAEVAQELEKSPQYLRVHWFSQFWSIPEDYQSKVLRLLEKKIKEQNEPIKH